MSESRTYLMAIAVGPVQDFIAASRKTRDLWFGSMLLGKVAREAAAALREANPPADLIFPALPPDAASDDETPIPNKLLAIVTTEDPSAVAAAVEARARATVAAYIGRVQERLKDADELVDWELTHAQVKHFLECYAAWVPYDPNAADANHYSQCRRRVELLLAGRKALRDFRPAFGRAGAAKSSLDPSRETVLRVNGTLSGAGRPIQPTERRRLNLRGGEQLDGVSLLKRHGQTKRFVSVSRVAIDPFIRRLSRGAADPTALTDLTAMAKELEASNVVERFPVGAGSGLERYGAFRYDCQLFYGRGLNDPNLTEEEKPKAQAFFDRVEAARTALDIGELPTYLAVLAADGDRMGKAISDIKDPVKHQDFSKLLAGFASEARDIVQHYCGATVYTGGDDVLAFLPLDTALCCADELRRRFAAIVNERGAATQVSLSVGLAVGHFGEHLQDLLGWARDAERAAKALLRPDGEPAKNALAVSLHTRAGGAEHLTVVRSWDDAPVVNRWLRWIGWHRRDWIPDGAAYELRELEREMRKAGQGVLDRRFRRDGRPTEPDAAGAVSLLDLEVERILRRKQPGHGGGRLTERQITCLLDLVHNDLDELRTLVDELIIARRIAAAIEVAHGARVVEKGAER